MSLQMTRLSRDRAVTQWCSMPYRGKAKQFWKMSKEEWTLYQRHRFLEIYQDACTTIPYYRMRQQMYPELKLQEEPLENLLLELPILKKHTLQKHNLHFFPAKSAMGTSRWSASDAVGSSLMVQATLQERGMEQAIFDWWKKQVTGTTRPRTIYLLGSMKQEGQTWLSHSHGANGVHLSIYHLHKRYKDEIVRFINDFDPQYIEGYPSAIYELAKLAGDALFYRKNRTVAMAAAETLAPEWKAVIEQSLCSKVYDVHSSQEGAYGVFECSYGHKHIHPMFGIVEVVREDGTPTEQGEWGRLVVTGLLRKSMPLIRYEIGNRAAKGKAHGSCPCGVSWDWLESIEGRIGDQLQLEDGRRISMLVVNHMIDGMQGIEIHGAQLIQHTLRRFELLIAMKERDQGSRKYVQQSFRRRFAALVEPLCEVELELTFVTEIPREANGTMKLADVRL